MNEELKQLNVIIDKYNEVIEDSELKLSNLKELYKFDYDARRSSSILIDGEILVDCGIHTLDSLRIAGIDYDKISD